MPTPFVSIAPTTESVADGRLGCVHAQVHHAVAHDGRELAVKIQYPTLRDEFSGDMFTHWLVLNMADMLFDRTS
jgi:hypothetical protein